MNTSKFYIACQNCPTIYPKDSLKIKRNEWEESGPVSLEPLSEENAIFHMPTSASSKYIAENTAKELLIPSLTAFMQPGRNLNPHSTEARKIALLKDHIGFEENNSYYFTYKCPLTRKEFVVEMKGKYRVEGLKPTIYECKEPSSENNSEQFHLEQAIMKMLTPWFDSFVYLQGNFAKYNPLIFFGKVVVVLGNKTKCYKTLTALVTITDISLRILSAVGLFFLVLKTELWIFNKGFQFREYYAPKLHNLSGFAWTKYIWDVPTNSERIKAATQVTVHSFTTSIVSCFFLYKNLSTREKVFCVVAQTSLIGFSIYKQFKPAV